ncbi:MAG TPA: hypothetical protein VGH33_16415, partial [Isosphaeraceae bacterium]
TPPVPPDADLSEKLAPEIRSVPTRPGGLKVTSGPPDAFSPNLTPDDTENWRVGDASLVEMSGKGLVISGGTAGNFFVTRRSDYKKCTITVDLSATEGTDAYLVLRGNEGPDGWRGVTSRVVDKGGKIHSGLQSLDFAEPELGGVLAAGDPRAEVLPRTNTRVTFSIDEKNAATVTSKLRKTTVAHDGPRRLDAAGAAGLFVRKGSVTVRSVRVEE